MKTYEVTIYTSEHKADGSFGYGISRYFLKAENEEKACEFAEAHFYATLDDSADEKIDDVSVMETSKFIL